MRSELAGDFARIESMLDKLERGELHVAVFGRVSAGKSALGNALLGREAFTVGVLHGTTTDAEHAVLDEAQHDGLVLIDTPGINELDGEARERLAFEVAEVSDLVVFVCDGDLTREELDALKTLAATQRPLLLALNKADRYGRDELDSLLQHLRLRVAGLVRAEDVLAVAARPAAQRVVEVDARGHEQSHEQAARRPTSPPCANACWRSPRARARRCRRSTPACMPAGSPTRSAHASRRPARRWRRN